MGRNRGRRAARPNPAADVCSLVMDHALQPADSHMPHHAVQKHHARLLLLGRHRHSCREPLLMKSIRLQLQLRPVVRQRH
eukprot:176673-Chlamydomonas_euryale.AAC.1